MARIINILPENVVNKIAAGEVVQRPASAVKELIENCIDAGATSITIIVKDGGSTLIKVVDNGCGMGEEDAVISIERHATSKIKTADDLEKIRTLGFRGEALASVAAVSQMELVSRRREDDVATQIRIEGGEVKESGKTSLEPGTSVTVKNLYYNTPARRNFLKSDATEFKHIADVVQRTALAHPEIAIDFIADGEEIFRLPVQSERERFRALLGEKLCQSLIPFSEITDHLTIHGHVAKPDFARKTRSEQYIYLNKRFIINRSLNHAVFQAFEHLVEKGSFPFFILHLEIDPQHVDVNVHPSKMEVKFDDERNIYHFVLTIIRRALALGDTSPDVLFSGTKTEFGNANLRFDSVSNRISPDEIFSFVGSRPSGDKTFSAAHVSIHLDVPADSEKIQDSVLQSRVVDADSSTNQTAPEFRPIWQLHNKYILSQIHSGLMMIDQHAAHERILYERAMLSFENAVPISQQLLFAETLTLSPTDYAGVKELLPYLEKLGFDMKLFGKNTVVMEGVPADVRPGREHAILQEVIDRYKENENSRKLEIKENIAASFACKAAIKAGDKLTHEEMRNLIDQLFAAKMPYVCPHGRPAIIKISIEELDKRFGRT